MNDPSVVLDRPTAADACGCFADAPPLPMGCAACGHAPYAHGCPGQSADHEYAQPSGALMAERLEVRRQLGLGQALPTFEPAREVTAQPTLVPAPRQADPEATVAHPAHRTHRHPTPGDARRPPAPAGRDAGRPRGPPGARPRPPLPATSPHRGPRTRARRPAPEREPGAERPAAAHPAAGSSRAPAPAPPAGARRRPRPEPLAGCFPAPTARPVPAGGGGMSRAPEGGTPTSRRGGSPASQASAAAPSTTTPSPARLRAEELAAELDRAHGIKADVTNCAPATPSSPSTTGCSPTATARTSGGPAPSSTPATTCSAPP